MYYKTKKLAYVLTSEKKHDIIGIAKDNGYKGKSHRGIFAVSWGMAFLWSRVMSKRKKKKRRNKNNQKTASNPTTTNKKQTSSNSGQAFQQEKAPTIFFSTDNQNSNDIRYFGLKAKTWAIIVLVFIGILSLVFLVTPYIVGLVTSTINGNIDDFVSKINGYTIALSIVGTVASVLSIIITFLDQKRFSNEKEYSEQLLTDVKNLGNVLQKVSTNIESIKDDNEKLSLELHHIKDELYLSTQVVDGNFDLWKDRQESKETD